MNKRLHQLQHELADAIRQPANESSFEPRRLAIYQELFFNNIEGFCATSFPVLKRLFSESDWLTLVREFFVTHRCETPHFIEISQEFLAFLSYRASELPWPWTLELAHYEWVELACSVAEDENEANDDFKNKEQVNPEFELDRNLIFRLPESTWPLAYNYPVHTISEKNYREIQPAPTQAIVYRDEAFNVQFISTDALTIHLLQFIRQKEYISLAEMTAFLIASPMAIEENKAKAYLQVAIPQLVAKQILRCMKK